MIYSEHTVKVISKKNKMYFYKNCKLQILIWYTKHIRSRNSLISTAKIFVLVLWISKCFFFYLSFQCFIFTPTTLHKSNQKLPLSNITEFNNRSFHSLIFLLCFCPIGRIIMSCTYIIYAYVIYIKCLILGMWFKAFES